MSRGAGILHVPRPSRITASVTGRFGPPALDPALVSDVLADFGLDSRRATRNLLLQRRSLNAAVRTPQGRKVVKQYRPQWTPATVQYGHSILGRLEEVGFPAVRIVRTVDGALCTTRGDRVFGVFDFAPGRNYSLNFLLRADRLRLTARAARTLARLHRALDGFVPEGSHHMGLITHDGPRRRDVAWHAAKLDELRDRSAELDDPEAHGLATGLAADADRILEELTELEERLGRAGLKSLVIHGDYGLHNLLFRRDDAIPVDFELARLDWRVNDLVSVLGKYRLRGDLHDVESMETFMEAYGSEFPLTDTERDLLPDAWRLYRLQQAVQYWNSYFETGGPTRKLRSARGALVDARWPDLHADTLAQLARLAGRPASVTLLQPRPRRTRASRAHGSGQ